MMQTFEEEYIQSLIEGAYVAWNNKKGPRDGIHASDILKGEGEYCHREMVLGTFFVKEVTEITSHLANIFLNGWFVHEYYQQVMSQVWTHKEREILEMMFAYAMQGLHDEYYQSLMQDQIQIRSDQLTKDKGLRVVTQFIQDVGGFADEAEKSHYAAKWGLSFTPDVIIRIRDIVTKLYRRYIVEIKGYNNKVYEDILSRDDPMVNSEFRKAAVQANLYMHLLEIDKAAILIEDKGTQNFRVWVRKYDPELAKPYIQRLDDLVFFIKLYRKEKLLPERICENSNDERAMRCPLRTACFAAPEAREKLRK
jgi:hypothetical protein